MIMLLYAFFRMHFSNDFVVVSGFDHVSSLLLHGTVMFLG